MDLLTPVGQSNTACDVFISYSHSDIGAAQILAELLEANGLSVWWDRRLAPGDKFHALIEQKLEMAKAVVVLWSSASVKSDWVLGEAQTAHDAKKLIPVRIDECKLPIPYRGIHTPDIYKNRDQLDELARLLALKLGSCALSKSGPDVVGFSAGSSANFFKSFANQVALISAESQRMADALDWANPFTWIGWLWNAPERWARLLFKHWKIGVLVLLIAWMTSVIITMIFESLGKKVDPRAVLLFLFGATVFFGAMIQIFKRVANLRIKKQRD
jgi:hypothetical protein